MKTPEEKAEELHTEYYRSFKLSNSERDISWSRNHAKRCAIIYCDGIIKELEKLRKPEYTTFILRYNTYKPGTIEVEREGESCDGYELIDYWQSVKTVLKTNSN